MGLYDVIKTASAALGISKSAAAKLAQTHGREGLIRTLDALADALASHRLSQTSLARLPPELLGVLNSAVSGGKHASAIRTPEKQGGFSTRPAPRTVGARNSEPPLPGEEVDEFLCPSSSNLYSFSFVRQPGATTGDLFVTFRAVNLNLSSITKGTTRAGKRESLPGLIGTAGKTVAGGKRPFSPGSRYRYFKVPISVYAALKNAHSKGEELWSKVRVRGTVWGTKYQYQLVSSDVHLGAQGSYIPRRSTQGGFRSRSLRVAGGGFLTSTLRTASNGTGFTTRPAPVSRKRGR